MPSNAWWSKYVGIPFEQLDCWALVAKVEKEIFGRDFSCFDDFAIELHRRFWGKKWADVGKEVYKEIIHQTDSPKAGDIALYGARSDQDGMLWHVGVIVDDQCSLLLHTAPKFGSVVSRLNRPAFSRLRPTFWTFGDKCEREEANGNTI